MVPKAVRSAPCPVHVTPADVPAVPTTNLDAPARVPDVPPRIPVVLRPLHVTPTAVPAAPTTSDDYLSPWGLLKTLETASGSSNPGRTNARARGRMRSSSSPSHTRHHARFQSRGKRTVGPTVRNAPIVTMPAIVPIAKSLASTRPA